MHNRRHKVRARALKTPDHRRLLPAVGLAVLAVLALMLLWTGSAQAQFPRIGISGAPDHYQETLDVVAGEDFTLYVGIYGVDDETPLDQPFSSLSWVLHQVCCGAVLYIQDVEYSPAFQHEGNPYLGVISSAEVCVDEPFITLATLTLQMVAPADGEYLAACGPYQQAIDCDGGNPIVMGLPMTLSITGVTSPVAKGTWGAVKATYR